MAADDVLIELSAVTKDYRALRPLRVQRLALRAGESIALLGFDAAMSEVLVNLITGAQLPDTGQVTIFGRATTAVTNVDEWVADLDRFGLISDRAVLVEQFTAEQNLALPLSLEIHEMASPLKTTVRQLAAEVGLSADELSLPTSALTPVAQLRLRLGRALALMPRVLIAEHPNATLSSDEAPAFAADFARIIGARRISSLVMTADATFAGGIADRVLALQPATGELKAASGWRRWFS
jgi:predicted ABC-type transport system involved in lysophospholipase L1 biosynthesis ATPase subunit